MMAVCCLVDLLAYRDHQSLSFSWISCMSRNTSVSYLWPLNQNKLKDIKILHLMQRPHLSDTYLILSLIDLTDRNNLSWSTESTSNSALKGTPLTLFHGLDSFKFCFLGENTTLHSLPDISMPSSRQCSLSCQTAFKWGTFAEEIVLLRGKYKRKYLINSSAPWSSYNKSKSSLLCILNSRLFHSVDPYSPR